MPSYTVTITSNFGDRNTVDSSDPLLIVMNETMDIIRDYGNVTVDSYVTNQLSSVTNYTLTAVDKSGNRQNFIKTIRWNNTSQEAFDKINNLFTIKKVDDDDLDSYMAIEGNLEIWAETGTEGPYHVFWDCSKTESYSGMINLERGDRIRVYSPDRSSILFDGTYPVSETFSDRASAYLDDKWLSWFYNSNPATLYKKRKVDE